MMSKSHGDCLNISKGGRFRSEKQKKFFFEYCTKFRLNNKLKVASVENSHDMDEKTRGSTHIFWFSRLLHKAISLKENGFLF